MQDKIQAFKNREVKGKEVFTIQEIGRETGWEFVRNYHYLGDIRYLAIHSFGMYIGEQLVGVATFGSPQGNVALKGWFGLDNTHKDILELTRLCLLPELNKSNATSYLLGNTIQTLRKKYKVRAIISLADSHKHIGSIYQVCNFTYHGLTDAKMDFCRKYEDGTFKRGSRGTTKGVKGVWIDRSRKHRYAYIMDKSLVCMYIEQERPKEVDEVSNCYICKGTLQVIDNRLGDIYTCPECTGRLDTI